MNRKQDTRVKCKPPVVTELPKASPRARVRPLHARRGVYSPSPHACPSSTEGSVMMTASVRWLCFCFCAFLRIVLLFVVAFGSFNLFPFIDDSCVSSPRRCRLHLLCLQFNYLDSSLNLYFLTIWLVLLPDIIRVLQV
jgi:hypothetical protein